MTGPAEDARKETVKREGERRKRILVVDDDRVTLRWVQGILEGDGHEVAVAARGAEALEVLAGRDFDLLLVDVWMPEMTGMELLEKIRAPGKNPKAIVMTADDTPETMLGAIREQAYRYLHKPLTPEVLRSAVREVLEMPELLPIQVVSAKPDWVELLVPCQREAVDRIEPFLSRLEADLSEGVRMAVGHAFRELLMNAIEWGGRFDPSRSVRLAYLRMRRMILYRIADPGPGFRFDELAHSAVTHPGDPIEHVRVREEMGLRSGGFGILMTQALVDELLYNETQNEVVFVKYLEPNDPEGIGKPGS